MAQFGRNWRSAASLLHYEPAHAAITLPFGHCDLHAERHFLDIVLTTNSVVDATILEDLVSCELDHLSRGERLRYQWILSAAQNSVPRPNT